MAFNTSRSESGGRPTPPALAALGNNPLIRFHNGFGTDGRLPGACYGCALFRLRPRLEAAPV